MKDDAATTTSSAGDLSLTPTQQRVGIAVLMTVMFAHSYLMISVFPYRYVKENHDKRDNSLSDMFLLFFFVIHLSGFMAIELVEGANEENAGSYAGLISSMFFIARTVSSFQWGQFSDIYGRKIAIQMSLGLSLVFSILFGLSSSFALALLWRFLLGLSNNLMVTLRVVASEIACGDEDLENQAMNLVMSMWGVGMLIAPAISGAVSEPTRQYPTIDWLQEGPWADFLERYPFFAPNVVAAALCAMSMVIVHFFVVETLSTSRLRHVKHMPSDALKHMLSVISEGDESTATSEDDERKPLKEQQQQHNLKDSFYNSTKDPLGGNSNDNHRRPSRRTRQSSIFSSLNSDLQSFYEDTDMLDAIEEDVRDASRRASQVLAQVRPSAIMFSERARHSVLTTVATRESIVVAHRASILGGAGMLKQSLKKRASTIEQLDNDELLDLMGTTSGGGDDTMSIADLWNDIKIRKHLLVYCFVLFVSVALDEAFPLFCLSTMAGLGLQENYIGAILSVSGLFFTIMQLTLFTPMVDRFGLVGSIRLACILMPVFAILIPVSLGLNQSATEPGMLTPVAFVYLIIVMAGARLWDMTFLTGMSIAINRLVEPEHRGTLR